MMIYIVLIIIILCWGNNNNNNNNICVVVVVVVAKYKTDRRRERGIYNYKALLLTSSYKGFVPHLSSFLQHFSNNEQ